MLKKIIRAIFILSVIIFSSCEDEPVKPDSNTGKLTINFGHKFNEEFIDFDTLKYINTAGNKLQFSEIQYFISDVTLHYPDGSEYVIHSWKDIHYIDSDILSSLTWYVYDSIPAGLCDSLSFTFGINEEKNQSFLYVNPPESLMFWPDILGGGYHYMKLNGKWLTHEGKISPFNFHLGIGQIYDNEGNITGFVQNYFRVVIKNHPFNISKDESTSVIIMMDVASWFDTPHVWDFDYWGGDIMQKQPAMQTGCENGRDVFSLEIIIPD